MHMLSCADIHTHTNTHIGNHSGLLILVRAESCLVRRGTDVGPAARAKRHTLLCTFVRLSAAGLCFAARCVEVSPVSYLRAKIRYLPLLRQLGPHAHQSAAPQPCTAGCARPMQAVGHSCACAPRAWGHQFMPPRGFLPPWLSAMWASRACAMPAGTDCKTGTHPWLRAEHHARSSAAPAPPEAPRTPMTLAPACGGRECLAPTPKPKGCWGPTHTRSRRSACATLEPDEAPRVAPPQLHADGNRAVYFRNNKQPQAHALAPGGGARTSAVTARRATGTYTRLPPAPPATPRTCRAQQERAAVVSKLHIALLGPAATHRMQGARTFSSAAPPRARAARSTRVAALLRSWTPGCLHGRAPSTCARLQHTHAVVWREACQWTVHACSPAEQRTNRRTAVPTLMSTYAPRAHEVRLRGGPTSSHA